MTMRLEIELPWPSSELSPNARHGHWGAPARAKKRYRHACCIATLEATRGIEAPKLPMRLRLVFHPPPDKSERDRDNLVARMKSGLDGVADGLRIDDSLFVEGSYRVGEPATSKLLARVSLTITLDVPEAASR